MPDMQDMQASGTSGLGTVPEGTEATIFGAIRELAKISRRIDKLVFGERPKAEVKSAEPVAADIITRARNRIMDINKELAAAASRLETIGR